MGNEKLEKKYRPSMESSGVLVLRDVITVNHKPHPFMVGPKHVAHASDHCGGMLGEETLNKIPCSARGCGMPYKDHTYDTVIAVSLARDCIQADIQSTLEEFCKENDAAIKHDKIDGFIFVKNNFSYSKGGDSE